MNDSKTVEILKGLAIVAMDNETHARADYIEHGGIGKRAIWDSRRDQTQNIFDDIRKIEDRS